MKTSTLALTLALATVSPQAVWPADLERTSRVIETALALPPDAPISLKTRNKANYRGRLLAVNDTHLTFRTLQDGRISDLTLPYADIHSIKRTDKPMSPAKAVLITLGVLYGIGVVFAAFVNH
jgi:hypothetical protein